MRSIMQDIRYALRQLRKSPGFTLTAILTLALGIGIVTAAFAIVDAAVLRSWPAREPGRLVEIRANTPQGQDVLFSYPDAQDLAAKSETLEGILAYARYASTLQMEGESPLLLNEAVSPNYFSLLGTDPDLGRRFEAAATRGEAAVVISNSMWQRFFGSDPKLIGKQIMLTGRSYTVVGVAPPGFRGMTPFVPVELWFPLTGKYGASNRAFREFQLVGRLKPGVTSRQAQAELETIGQRLAQSYPDIDKGRNIVVISERQRLREAATPTVLLMSSVGMVLLICCANVAGLILARGDARRREIAMRMALGGTRLRLIRQLITESLLLGVAGAAAGLLLTVGIFRLQPALMPPSDFALGLDLRLNFTVALFVMIVSLFAVAGFGLTPAIQATKLSCVSALKGEERSIGRILRRLTLRNILVVAEISLAATLLAASGLVLRSLLKSMNMNLGFDHQRHLVFFDLNPDLVADYNPARSENFFEQVEMRAAALPGVRHAGLARRVLLSGSGGGAEKRVAIPGVQLPQGQTNIPIKFNAVDSSYFQTMGTRLLEGREFTPADGAKSKNVVVISRFMANRFWPDGSALGRQIVVEGKPCEVVGVVEDAKVNHPHEGPEPYMYLPFAQWPRTEVSLILESGGDLHSLIAEMRNVLGNIDKRVPYEISTVHDLMNLAFWQDQTAVYFAGALGMLAIFLAAIGLYGVIAYVVSRRTQEIGVRMALGAQRSDIARMVLRQGLTLSLIGLGTGLVVSLPVMRLLSSLLYGVKPIDPLSFGASAVLVVLVALAASWIPARRAASIEPMQALRTE